MLEIGNLVLAPSEDPTGNGQPAAQLVYTDENGTRESRLFIYVHGGQRIKAAYGSGTNVDVFEVNEEGRFLIADL